MRKLSYLAKASFGYSIATAFAIGAHATEEPRGTDQASQAVCTAALDRPPAVSGIVVEDGPVNPASTLRSLRVVDRQSKGAMRIFYHPVAERAARARAACFGIQMRMLAQATLDGWPRATWSSVIFTPDADFVSLPGEKGWKIVVQPDGSIGKDADRTIRLTMPHEQVHAFQGRAGTTSPRWFHEGHAEWISRPIAARIAPAEASASADRYAKALAQSSVPVALAAWGGMQPTRESILRQVNAEDRKKMEADPTYFPANAGPWVFRDGDIVSDESNTEARYEAAFRVFDRMERAYGRDAVQQWVNRLTAKPGKLSQEDVAKSAVATFGGDWTLEDRSPAG